MFSVLFFVFFIVCVGSALVPVPRIQIKKPTLNEISNYLRNLQNTNHNHEKVKHIIAEFMKKIDCIERRRPSLESVLSCCIFKSQKRIGEGVEIYKKATDLLFSLNFIGNIEDDREWCGIYTDLRLHRLNNNNSNADAGNEVGRQRENVAEKKKLYSNDCNVLEAERVVVVAKCFKIWSYMPSEICAVIKDKEIGKNGKYLISAFAVSTLNGHMLAGEEIFGVVYNYQDNSVHFVIHSFSKPAGVLSYICAPVVRRSQATFVDQTVERFAQLIRG